MDKEYKESNEITNLTLKKEENGGIVGKEISKNNIIFFFKKSYLWVSFNSKDKIIFINRI